MVVVLPSAIFVKVMAAVVAPPPVHLVTAIVVAAAATTPFSTKRETYVCANSFSATDRALRPATVSKGEKKKHGRLGNRTV